MDAEAYALYTLGDVTDDRRGWLARRAVEPQQDLLVRARRPAPPGRARPARARRRAARCRRHGEPAHEGLRVRPLRPDLRRHQRDPTQHRGRARARAPEEVGRPAMRFALHRRPARVRRRGPRPARQGVHAGARCASRWDRDDGRIPGLWSKLAEMGVVGMLAPEGVGGLGMSELDLVLLLAEAGRAASARGPAGRGDGGRAGHPRSRPERRRRGVPRRDREREPQVAVGLRRDTARSSTQPTRRCSSSRPTTASTSSTATSSTSNPSAPWTARAVWPACRGRRPARPVSGEAPRPRNGRTIGPRWPRPPSCAGCPTG